MKFPMGAPIDRSLVWIFFFAWRFAIDLVYLGEAVRPNKRQAEEIAGEARNLMTSQRQIEANRLNAQGSTGPRTPDGKERVASNALKHGLTGKRVVLPNENPEEFDTFRSALWEELGPRGALEEVLAEEIVADVWRLRRVPILEATVHARDEQELIVHAIITEIARIKAATDRDSELFERMQKRELTPAERKALNKAQANLKEAQAKLDEPTLRVTRVLERHADELERLWRRGEALRRSMFRALHELQRLQALRAGEPVTAPAVLDVDVDIRHSDAGAPES